MTRPYKNQVYLYTVYIYETFNPGAIVAIFSGDCKGRWTQLWSGPTQKVGHKPRAFQPPIDSLDDYPINQLRLIFNQVWPLSQYFPVSLICLRDKSMTPRRGNTILFRSSQQLPRLRLGPLKGFLS